MNKRTRAIDEDTYKLIIATMKNGFTHEGVQYKPNERIATVLVLEYNLGLRVGDILNLCVICERNLFQSATINALPRPAKQSWMR